MISSKESISGAGFSDVDCFSSEFMTSCSMEKDHVIKKKLSKTIIFRTCEVSLREKQILDFRASFA